ncbi:hypothetical protein CJ030_MR1G014059 [Morella rubra]|uniref:Uncharacterized protein n=1 Tax=Morella rubra TaxID=262757 RepID=A0A6A1WRR5_9ROSI|nr:hypothetical protein CJ030_MR1G014059 [Morella rubra]
MMSKLLLLKADSQLTRTKLLQMQGTNQKMDEAMGQLITDNDLISSAHIILQAKSKKNRVDIQWIINYLRQEEAADVVATTKSYKTYSAEFPYQSPPPASDNEHLSFDEDGHEDLSDMD